MARAPRRPPRIDRVHGDVRSPRRSAWDAVWALTRRIPRGKVMTYGQIASLLEQRLSPRAVGWALHGCPEDVPWQRVVNASGSCSTERLPDVPPGLQQTLLEREGVRFDEKGRLDLERYRFAPRIKPPPAKTKDKNNKNKKKRIRRTGPARSAASRP